MACDECDPWSEGRVKAMFDAYERLKNSESAMDRMFAKHFEIWLESMMKPLPFYKDWPSKIIKWET